MNENRQKNFTKGAKASFFSRIRKLLYLFKEQSIGIRSLTIPLAIFIRLNSLKNREVGFHGVSYHVRSFHLLDRGTLYPLR